MLIKKISKQYAGATTMVAVAQKLNVKTTDARNVYFTNSYLPAAGNEQRVIGYAGAMKQGWISKPIIGENGVYVIAVMSITEPACHKRFGDKPPSDSCAK